MSVQIHWQAYDDELGSKVDYAAAGNFTASVVRGGGVIAGSKAWVAIVRRDGKIVERLTGQGDGHRAEVEALLAELAK